MYIALFYRPHCGGNYYTPNNTELTYISDYYSFLSADSQHFICFCPPGVTGDRCQSCSVDYLYEGEGEVELYRYQKTDGVCVDCDCTSLSESPQCDSTGQCPCRDINGEDIELAGRQCVSFGLNTYMENTFLSVNSQLTNQSVLVR